MQKEYKGIRSAKGPLIFLEKVDGAFNEEIIEIIEENGKKRLAQIVRLEENMSIARVFEGTQELNLEESYIKYTGKPFNISLSKDILGRYFDGASRAIDGGGNIYSNISKNINGRPINPMSRVYPKNYINTGISSIDSLITLIRGQKLPIFSASGLAHKEMAAQLLTNSQLKDSDETFAVVFGAIGITKDDANFFMDYANSSGMSDRLVCYFNYAGDPVSERLSAPRCAITAAEYLAFDLDMNVLVILLDITSYCEGLREISSSREEVPSRKGFPGYLYSDLASLYERAGIIKDSSGSLTMIPILTMPSDDISHPIPDLTGYITEGQIVLSRLLNSKGIFPPIDVLPSLSRLMKDAIGEGYTREDHSDLYDQLFSSYSKVGDIRSLAQIMGRDDLSKSDRLYLDFGDQFEERFINQKFGENRSLDESLDLGWELLSILQDSQLDRLTNKRIKEFVRKEI